MAECTDWVNEPLLYKQTIVLADRSMRYALLTGGFYTRCAGLGQE